MVLIRLDVLVEKVEPMYDARDPAHRFDHIRRIMKFCQDAGRRMGADSDLLLRAAAIHGVKPKERLRDVLGDDYEKVVTLARNAAREPKTLEENILRDANTLESLGVIGLARSFTKGGYEGQTIEETISVIRKNMSQALRTKEGQRIADDRLRYMKEFLDRLDAVLRTSSGG